MKTQQEYEGINNPSPDLLRKIQLDTEGGSILCSNYVGGYDLLTEIYKLIAKEILGEGYEPEGWKLVPYIPTEEMQKASEKVEIDPMYSDGAYFADGDDLYKAMLDAAPKPPINRRKPLTRDQVAEIHFRWGGDMMDCTRAIERAHGIEEQQT